MRHPRDFRATVRGGARSRSALVVAYAAARSDSDRLVGCIVSKAVGNSVVRHRITRRFRAVMREQLELIPAGCGLVLRATPLAATASYAQLKDQVATNVAQVVSKTLSERRGD